VKGSQLRAILWLRWRLTRNQWVKSGGIGAALAALGLVFGAMLAVTGFTGGVAGGWLGLRGAPPVAVMIAWLVLSVVFLFVWTLGVLVDLQRSEPIDVERLMHLPVALSQAFAVNYVASLAGMTIALFVPTMLGLCLGLALDRGPAMLLLAPLSMGLVFMVTAWTYLLQGWIATWVRSPRRRRVLVTTISMVMLLCFQVPNLAFNVFGHHDPAHGDVKAARAESEARERRVLDRLLLAEKIVPPLWLAGGAAGLADGDPLVALLGTLGFAALGALGLRRGYTSTLRFYTGAGGGGGAPLPAKARAVDPATSRAPGRRRLVERRLPGVSEQASAVAAATLRSMLRAPELAMGLGAGLLIAVIACAGMLFRLRAEIPAYARPLVVAGPLALVNLMLTPLFANQFGYDRDALRALLLAPVPRHRLLLGKNLAALAIAAPLCSVMLLGSAAWLRLPLLAVAAALLQMATLLLVYVMVGNLMSIFFPFRVQAGSMKATKPPAGPLLAMIGCQFGLPFLSAPALAGPIAVLLGHHQRWAHPVVVDFALSLVLAAAAAAAYAASLAPLGRLLQRRETLILARVAVENE
jgi:hypothetical protein